MPYSKKLLIGLLVLSLLPTTISLYVSWKYVAVVWKPKIPELSSKSLLPGLKQLRLELTKQQRALLASYFWASVALLGSTLFITLLSGFLLIRPLVTQLLSMRAQIHQAAPHLFREELAPTQAPLEALRADIFELLNQFQEYQQNEVFKEQVARWQDVARRLAHEIRNPLTPILLSVQELHKQYKDADPKYQKKLDTSLEIVRDEVETLTRLVEEFSSFAKLPQIKPRREDLMAVVHEFLEAYQWFREQTSLTLEGIEGSLWVSLDKILFRRVLHNLVLNAIEAGSPSIHIRVGKLMDNEAICQIEDRGPGIPEHLQSKIFTPYFTTKQFGTGLGLSITKKIVIDHGGAISVAPNPGGGSVFTIRLKSTLGPTQELLL